MVPVVANNQIFCRRNNTITSAVVRDNVGHDVTMCDKDVQAVSKILLEFTVSICHTLLELAVVLVEKWTERESFVRNSDTSPSAVLDTKTKSTIDYDTNVIIETIPYK